MAAYRTPDAGAHGRWLLSHCIMCIWNILVRDADVLGEIVEVVHEGARCSITPFQSNIRFRERMDHDHYPTTFQPASGHDANHLLIPGLAELFIVVIFR